MLITFAHLGLLVLICRLGVLNRLVELFASVGRIAFTNYLMQSLLCGWFFYGYGLGMFERLERYELYYVVAAIWLLQLIYSPIWLRYFRMGPLEWAWRSLTYWKVMPIRHGHATVPVAQAV